MKSQLITCLALTVCGQLLAQKPVDPYMGEWKGSLKLDGLEQPAVFAMIPLGNNRYEARVMSTFEKRALVEHRLRCLFEPIEGSFKAIDFLPFDFSVVVGTTDQGVVVASSLWNGKVNDGVVTGTVAGRRKGEFKLAQFKRTSPTLGLKPPAGALVLFDGRSLDAWQPRDGKGTVKWKLVEGDAMQVNGGDIVTKEKFADHKFHLEFRTPYMPTASGQGRGNSGVYPVGRYEVQVLDSYGLEGADNECGGIYTVARPAVNMCFPPLEWQTYDITFRAARTDASGKKTANPRITVVHNGVTIHDNLELPRTTGGAIDNKENEPGPLLLQDHGNPVLYRNIWVEKLN